MKLPILAEVLCVLQQVQLRLIGSTRHLHLGLKLVRAAHESILLEHHGSLELRSCVIPSWCRGQKPTVSTNSSVKWRSKTAVSQTQLANRLVSPDSA